MPRAPTPPRSGRFRRASDPGVKWRRYPLGASQFRLRQLLRPLTPEDHTWRWVTSGGRTPPKPAEET